jgi:hypothetical protein
LIKNDRKKYLKKDRISHIGPEEFIHHFINTDSKNLDENLKTSDLKSESNIQAYVLWNNRLSSLVSTEIVKNNKRENRVALINFFIETATACFELGNYNSTMSIIGLILA